ncbi:MAG: hypothetical protein K9G46_07065 [Flavobacteriales bacterium]|nr:hypothetical protein [Flavobacteriales bacterium]
MNYEERVWIYRFRYTARYTNSRFATALGLGKESALITREGWVAIRECEPVDQNGWRCGGSVLLKNRDNWFRANVALNQWKSNSLNSLYSFIKIHQFETISFGPEGNQH